MLSILTKYYGLDLLAMGLSFLGIYTIGNKQRYGFVIALCGNILWLTLGIITRSVGLIFANAVIAALYVRAYMRWQKTSGI
ncbi:MAG: PnuC protein [Candidatus Kerfeldbacteria bacterium]|nr:PnuC protein [Candidatus Kerfeldbacteria bacterium]